MAGPTAVIIVTFRMTVVRDGNGAYVLGNGSEFGIDRPPRMAGAGVVES